MTKHRTVTVAVLTTIVTCMFPLICAGNGRPERMTEIDRRLKEAVEFYERGMYERCGTMLELLPREARNDVSEGYKVLCSEHLRAAGYEEQVAAYISVYPYSALIPQIRYQYGLNLFDGSDYAGAAVQFEQISRHQLYRRQVPEFLFKKAYCDFELGNYERALVRFTELEKRPMSDFTAPARYAIGYINYGNKNFSEAIGWFEKSSKDPRFSEISKFYILECKFMLKDYAYVTEHGTGMVESAPADRLPKLTRMISESYLVLGDAARARQYYEMTLAGQTSRTRNDYFYAGSVLYAVDDYQGAIDNFSMMTDRTDSLGQIANYHLGYSYIQTKNKVAAMGAFRDASMTGFDQDIAEDAYFNYAKLAFDLNDDSSIFNDYLKRYPDIDKGDKIYSYMAVAALYNHDYAGAVAAYDNIDELDQKMRSNYMKANYLRAEQLIGNGAYRGAVPYLKAAAYYSDRRGMFNQMSRLWLAESYYRDKQYDEALSLYTELYNISALYGMPESYLVPYGIAYCYFKKEDYDAASKWFAEYLGGGSVKYRKDAMLRAADCSFMRSDYRKAAESYDAVLKDYFSPDDIYPYYQAAMAYGLENDNTKKISLLSNVEKASPASKFYAEAMFELGRSYVRAEQDEKAVACFDKIIGTVRDSTFIAQSYIELGTLSRNRSELDKALGYYKVVAEKMPLSGYADDALLAIESIYQAKNEPEEYLAYIESIGKASMKTEDEKEMMIFNAAEQIYLSENYDKALLSLKSYLEKYPAGARRPQSYFYIAECYKNLGQKEQACDNYLKVFESGEGSFVELAALNYANLSFSLEKYEDAFKGYSTLGQIARLDNNKFTAAVGMMRSAYKWRDFANALKYAREVAADSRSGDDLKREADYISAKSYLATSRRDEAFSVLEKLAVRPQTPEGAEAAYLLIVDRYDSGDFEEVENKVYAFSDAGTDQQYWLAKAFIVLGDSFAERNEMAQAKATFESIMSGYTPSGENDDVLDNVRMRLEKMDELNNQDEQ